MFCLRHYGQDAGGRRTMVNYFSTKAVAGTVSGAAGGEGQAAAVASTEMTVVQGAPPAPGERLAAEDRIAGALAGFEGVALDAEARAAIARALEECAGRARGRDEAIEAGGPAALDAMLDDAGTPYVAMDAVDAGIHGVLAPVLRVEEAPDLVPGEAMWELAGAAMSPERAALQDRIEARLVEGMAEVKRPKGRRANCCD